MNNTTTETPKLKIATTVKVDHNIDKEIELPYFFKSKYGNYCMVTVDKKLVQTRFYNKLLYSVSVTDEISKYEIEEITSGKEIKPEDFFETLYSAQSVIDNVLKTLSHEAA